MADLEDSDSLNGVTIGVCAMKCKSESQPMKEILSRMTTNNPNIRVIMISDDIILSSTPIDEWPYCDVLLAFFSKGYPLDKVVEYAKLKKPTMIINDLEMQYKLQDRREVYRILQEHDIDIPKHYVLDRDNNDELVETDDVIEINGSSLSKPFVEKPVSAEDHSVYVYFPSCYGGGSQRLFRKVKDRSSNYSKISTVRREGSFIYEEFLPTDGTDVKVYTVGPDYAHAEARKAPALDGKVDRDGQGKEKRYPVILNAKEKLIARKVCLAFKQTVCGFDLLRTGSKSYVCDVNGFSFVKSSVKYFDDCAQILLETILSNIAPHLFPSILPSVEYLADNIPVPIPSSTFVNRLQLRCVVGVFRHGDRTPKQKMKMIVRNEKFFELFDELGGYKKGSLKLKKPKDLQKVLDLTTELLESLDDSDPDIAQNLHKFQHLRSVLQMYRHFSGFNRKVQFKIVNGHEGAKPLLLLILKWGGVLTTSGQMCAEELGKAFRCMYPGGEGEYSLLPGSGFLRLHSTYRHDLKVYASDEGRVQLTAAAFTKGLLDLEGSVASVVIHLVKRDENATDMLDTSSDATLSLQRVKANLHCYMRNENDLTPDDITNIAPTNSPPLLNALHEIRNPHKACGELYSKMCVLMERIEEMESNDTNSLYNGEDIHLMKTRWKKLLKDFISDDGKFDISKIPDIYDCVKYDLHHNRSLVSDEALSVYKSSVQLADVVIPQEYGITKEEKIDISQRICSPLMKKICNDVRYSEADPDMIHRLDPDKSRGVISPKRTVRTRLYFTSESHIHSLVNILKHSGLLEESSTPNKKEFNENRKKFLSFPEWNYLSQIVFTVYEDLSKPPGEGLEVQVYVSPGVKTRDMIDDAPTLATDDSPKMDCQMDDLPILIGPQSSSIRRLPLQAPIARKTSVDVPIDQHMNSNKALLSTSPSLYTSPNKLLSSKRNKSFPSEKRRSLPTSDKSTTSLRSLHGRDSSERQLSDDQILDEGDYVSLVSVVDPLVHLCSLPIHKFEKIFSSLII